MLDRLVRYECQMIIWSHLLMIALTTYFAPGRKTITKRLPPYCRLWFDTWQVDLRFPLLDCSATFVRHVRTFYYWTGPGDVFHCQTFSLKLLLGDCIFVLMFCCRLHYGPHEVERLEWFNINKKFCSPNHYFRRCRHERSISQLVTVHTRCGAAAEAPTTFFSISIFISI